MTPADLDGAPAGAFGLRYEQLRDWRVEHPAWRLLAAEHAPMILSFLSQTFLEPNVRRMPRAELVEALNDHLESLRQREPLEYQRSAEQYIDAWAHPKTGRWLRKSHPQGVDNPFYEPTADVELAAGFCRDLGPRRFVGTASRLLTIRDLLRQIAVGSDTDPSSRIELLERQRAAIDAQLDAIRAGVDTQLEPAAVRERYEQVRQTARTLHADLRAVEESFRGLDRDVRAKSAMWDGPRGGLLEDVFGSAQAIDATDQGRSWAAFWEHLLNHAARTELEELLTAVEALPAVAGQTGEAEQLLRTDLFAAADLTQRTIASLSAQLRRFLDDDAWAENRRIGRLLRSTLATAARVRHDVVEAGGGDSGLPGAGVDAVRADVGLPAERPLHTRKPSPKLETPVDDTPVEGDLDLSELLELNYINLPALRDAVGDSLRTRGGIATLADVIRDHPISDGLAEVIGYLQVSAEQNADVLTSREEIRWQAGDQWRVAHMPTVLFSDLSGYATATTTPAGTVPATDHTNDTEGQSR